ncbi:hypothetical protein [Burkholderia gladioli]|uniref:hypothetical protein n=1 Tax=Burkholderia gladioli TaxID=28095 RepID=UPI001640428A|nr:hypothetical protein [Burkholderia gladioli]
MSDKLSELYFDPASTSPRVDELIAGVMKRFPGVSASAQARYYEEVHQHLAPLARELEAENARLRANAVAIWNNRAASPAPAIPAHTRAWIEKLIDCFDVDDMKNIGPEDASCYVNALREMLDARSAPAISESEDAELIPMPAEPVDAARDGGGS